MSQEVLAGFGCISFRGVFTIAQGYGPNAPLSQRKETRRVVPRVCQNLNPVLSFPLRSYIFLCRTAWFELWLFKKEKMPMTEEVFRVPHK